MPARRIGVIDTTFRSLMHLQPTRLARMGHLSPILETMDRVGFRAVDVWGDMTFDHALHVLQESPWERLRSIALHFKSTPLQLSLRGRCLLGFRPYADDVIEEFVRHATDCGVRSFLVYDSLNDLPGLEAVSRAVKIAGGQLVVCWVQSGLSEPRLDKATRLARSLGDLGADALCLKTASAMGPHTARALLGALRKATRVPIQVDLDNAGGLAAVSAVACVDAGAEVVYASTAPGWLDDSGLSTRILTGALADGGPAVDAAPDVLSQVVDFMAALSAPDDAAACRAGAGRRRAGWPELLEIPVGVVDQIVARLGSQAAEDRLPEVLKETVTVRGELGEPALVPPLAQIVATQAVLNVLYGKRWHIVSDEMKSYLRGGYGRPIMPISEDVRRLALTGDLEPDLTDPPQSLADLRVNAGQMAEVDEDVFLHAFAPESAAAFLAGRRAARRVDLTASAGEQPTPPDGDEAWGDLGPERIRDLVSLLEASNVEEMTVENEGTKVTLRKTASGQGEGSAGGPATSSPSTEATAQPGAADLKRLTPVIASMVGTFYASPTPGTLPYAEVGQRVKAGDVLCILEAMKLMNEVVSDLSGTVAAVLVEDGAAVEYGQPLFLIDISGQ